MEQDVDTLFKEAVQYQKSNNNQQATKLYHTILQLNPQHYYSLCNWGVLLKQTKDYQHAIQYLQQAVILRPTESFPLKHLAQISEQCHNIPEALTYYQQALNLAPQDCNLLLKLAEFSENNKDTTAAINYYKQLVALQPDRTNLYLKLGNLLSSKYEKFQAANYYKQYLTRSPQLKNSIFPFMARIYLDGCNWHAFSVQEYAEEYLPDIFAHGSTSLWDLIALPLGLSSQEQLLAAQASAKIIQNAVVPLAQQLSFSHTSTPKSKLKIGYVSADFFDHATVHLMRGLFKRHDKNAFEIYVYSHGRDDNSPCRQSIIEDCHHFIDITKLSTEQVAQQIYNDNIDILIDLKGYTSGNRLEIFALRPAPIQVTYLGYPGTLGTDFIDYNIVDKIIVPLYDEQYFSEKLVYMPHSYQINDQERKIHPQTPTKKSCKLPEDAFIFCCFNLPYKIEPVIFSSWMRILKKVPHSVLWIYANSKEVVENLGREAEARGVSKNRLIFAPPRENTKHLARLQLADLFLDTHYVNAHTTASDALWTGVPVLTFPGKTFISRVSSSLLHAMGLPELVVPDLKSYEHMAIHFANHPQELNNMKQKIASRKSHYPLFDTNRFVRNLEQAYHEMWSLSAAGQQPRRIEVSED